MTSKFTIMQDTNWKYENLIYLCCWLLIFLVAFASMTAMFISSSASHPLLKALVRSGEVTAPYMVLFLIHNYLIAPLLVTKNKTVPYIILTVILVGAFSAFFVISPMKHRKEFYEAKARMEQMELRSPQQERKQDQTGPRSEKPEGRVPPRKPKGGKHAKHLRSFSLPPEALNVVVVILLIMANLGVKISIRQSYNKRRMEELEKENLNQQLQYLRYQINPHFFMNTLNNIHALVDIDPNEAKECILELSRLMRYILYEGSKPTIPLDNETEFLKQYISLMRIRYQGNVRIDAKLPENVPGVEIPPLLLISFVENAFKHGVSYDEDSYIEVNMEVRDDRLCFSCANSRHESHQDEHKGIGMENVRKRLGLLYGDNYVMKVMSDDKKYEIFVEIPVKYEKPETS